MAIFVSAIFHEKFPTVWYEWNVINNCVMQKYFLALTVPLTHMGTSSILREKKTGINQKVSKCFQRGPEKAKECISTVQKAHTFPQLYVCCLLL